jgi:TolA-binding protein
MFTLSRSAWMVMLAMLIILVGLFLVCAQKRAAQTANGNDLAKDDDQFKQELLQLLDLTEDSTATKPSKDMDVTKQPQDDVMALLQAEKDSKTVENKNAGQESQANKALESAPKTTPDNLGISAEMFTRLKGDVDRLEKTLESRSSTVDSLRTILDNRNARLQELETKLVSAKPAAGKSGKSSGKGSRAAISQSRGADAGTNSEYEAARSLFEQFKYRDAIAAFSKMLEKDPDNALADNCQYWIGECYFGLKEYQQAVMEFQKVFAYSMTDKYDDAQLMIGLSYTKSGQKEKAQKEFETFLNNYANSEYVRVARRYYRDI